MLLKVFWIINGVLKQTANGADKGDQNEVADPGVPLALRCLTLGSDQEPDQERFRNRGGASGVDRLQHTRFNSADLGRSQRPQNGVADVAHDLGVG